MTSTHTGIAYSRTHLFFGLIAFALQAACIEDACSEETRSLTEVPTWATPLTIVPPRFPKDSRAPEGGLRVDIVGKVLADGKMEPKSITAPAGSEKYADAVAEVLKWWQCVPAVDTGTCAPKPQDYSMAVWFEGSTESPKIDIAYPKDNAAKAEQTVIPPYDSISSPYVDFPDHLWRIEGYVKVLMLVATSGDVSEVNVLSSTPYGVFNSAVLTAAKEAKVKWKSPGPDKSVCTQREYVFCPGAATRNHVRSSLCS